jgi:hypothetical protein
MEVLYVGKVQETGPFTSNNTPPTNELWIFEQHGIYTALWGGMDSLATPMPPAPWPRRPLRTIYKFRRSTTSLSSMVFFEDIGATVRMQLQYTLLLHDPIAYLLHQEREQDQAQIFEFEMYKSLQGWIVNNSSKNSNLPATLPPFRDLLPPALRYPLANADLSPRIQGTLFTERGIKTLAVLRTIELSPTYQEMLYKAALALKEDLLEVKHRLLTFSPTTGALELDMKCQYYDALIDFWDTLFTREYPVLKTVVESVVSVRLPNQILVCCAALLNHLIFQSIEQIISIEDRATIASESTQPLQQTDIRNTHIQELYEAAQTNGWRISPAQKDVQEHVILHFNADDSLILTIPATYPQQDAIVSQVRMGSSRLPTRTVNQMVFPLVHGGAYDLKGIAQVVVDTSATATATTNNAVANTPATATTATNNAVADMTLEEDIIDDPQRPNAHPDPNSNPSPDNNNPNTF